MDKENSQTDHWTFLSNNAHVLICLTQDPQPTTRDIAAQVGITERAVQRVIRRLVEAGVLVIEKAGRRNRYILNLEQKLRHPLESHKTIGELINLFRLTGPDMS